jgi:hypothetical protein
MMSKKLVTLIWILMATRFNPEISLCASNHKGGVMNKSRNAQNLVTVNEAYRRFILSLERKRREPRTINTYHQRLGRFTDMFGDLPLAEITADEIDDWLDLYVMQSERFGSHPTRPTKNGRLSSATIGGYVQSIKTFICFCDTRNGS